MNLLSKIYSAVQVDFQPSPVLVTYIPCHISILQMLHSVDLIFISQRE